MCDFSGKLIAWLDHEFAEDDACEVERHVKCCAECGSQVQAYQNVSNTFDEYCEALLEPKAHRERPRWLPLVVGAATAAAVGLLLAFLPGPVEKLPLKPPALTAFPPMVSRAAIAPNKRNQRRRGVTPMLKTVRGREGYGNWMAAEPAIQIAIPGDAMFPPGALPEGISFVAKLSVAADGSAERINLQP
jgi:hypothetical protein